MRYAPRIGIAVVAVILAAGSSVGCASDPPKQSAHPPKQSADPPVDQSLLEFLGSVDPSTDSTQSDDGSWLTYLAQTNIGKAAKTSRAPAQPKPAGSEKPSG